MKKKTKVKIFHEKMNKKGKRQTAKRMEDLMKNIKN